MTDFLWMVFLLLGVAAMVGVLLTRLRPTWAMRRTALMAALPLPALSALACAIVFVHAATASKERCGVDACGMAMMFFTIGLGYALVAARLGAAVAAIIKRIYSPQ